MSTVADSGRRGARGGRLLGRAVLFVRQVVAELRKVIWPTRRELVGYTITVLVFVTVMALAVALVDFVAGRAMLALFG